MISVEISGIAELNARLAGLADTLQGKVLLDVAQAVYDSAEKGADAHTQTGALRQSTYVRKIGGGYEIGHDARRAPYAYFVHWGTKPHVIRPKDKKVLRWPAGGAFAFAGEVHHPGYAGDKWLERAAAEGIRQFDSIVARRMKDI